MKAATRSRPHPPTRYYPRPEKRSTRCPKIKHADSSLLCCSSSPVTALGRVMRPTRSKSPAQNVHAQQRRSSRRCEASRCLYAMKFRGFVRSSARRVPPHCNTGVHDAWVGPVDLRGAADRRSALRHKVHNWLSLQSSRRELTTLRQLRQRYLQAWLSQCTRAA